MIEKAKAIALHSVRYGEKSIIAYLYSEEFGRITLMVNSAFGKGKSSKKAIYFQPLNLVNIVFYRGTRSHSMGRLREVSFCSSLSNIHSNNTKRAIALFMGEVIYRTVREEERNASLFAFLEYSIQTLEVVEEGVQNFHIIFLAQLSKYLGFYPNGNYSADTPFFDIKSGLFCEIQPEHDSFLSIEQSELLSFALKLNYVEGINIKLNGRQRNSFLESLLRFYSFHNDSVQGIRSLPVLRQVFEE
jgi:DNA repair protein RecO (recombination protein O)